MINLLKISIKNNYRNKFHVNIDVIVQIVLLHFSKFMVLRI